MKNAFNSILLLTIVGFAVLVAGAFYFGAPLFGWIIMLAIFAVFLVEQFLAMGKVKQVAAEEELIDSCESRKSFMVNGDGVVAKRIKLAQELLQKGIRLDSPIAFEVLTGSSNVALPRSSSGTVILLGLMGTFFGLMYSVATAGGAMDNSTTQGTLDTIQVLFQNMKGIFGTSLCGLFAALILNASRTILAAKRDAFMARLDKLTLDMQGDSTEAIDSDKSEMERLFNLVTKNLNAVVDSVHTNLVGAVDKMGAELSKAIAPVNDNFKAVADSLKQSMEAVSAQVKTGFAEVSASTEKAMTSTSAKITESVSEQVKAANEQWKQFMDRLATATSTNFEQERAGIETLKDVAVQVAEKAQAGSAELSQSVAEKLGALSNDILGAFQKLSDTSVTLLQAQTALTESIDNRVVKEKEATDALGGNLVETAELMRVNQSELSANLEMLRSGLETILEKLSGDTAEHDEEENFVEHLNQTLEAFHERASEVLMENAVKTQEILLEVMEQAQRANIAAQQPKVEG